MKKCNQCHVYVDTDRKICPLCFNSLEENEKDEKISNEQKFDLYPKRITTKKQYNWFYKITVFICIISIIISTIVNYFTHQEGEKWWCLYVFAGIGYYYMLVRGVILTRTYVIKRLFTQLITISVLIWLIDFITDNVGWSLAYVIPGLAVVTNITNVIITISNRKNFGEGFNCLFLSLLWGCIPFILNLFKLLKGMVWPSLTSLCISIIILLGIIVFANNATKEEFKKRLHI